MTNRHIKKVTKRNTNLVVPSLQKDEHNEENVLKGNARKKKKTNAKVKKHILNLSLLFILFIIIIITFISFMPGLHIESRNKLTDLIPKSFSELINLNTKEKIILLYDSLNSYKNEHGAVLLILLSIFYIFYQSFPLFLWWMTGTASIITILIGALYNYVFSIFYCSILSTVAPLFAYAIFKYSGKPIVEHFFDKPLLKFSTQIKKHAKTKFDLFVYLAILRLTPIFPNSLINVLTASLSLPVLPFCLATYLGLFPNTVILVSIGRTINHISSINMNQHLFASLFIIIVLLCFQKLVEKKYKVELLNI